MSQIAPTAPQILVSPVVQLVNEDPERTFNMKYGPTQRLVLAPGERLFVNEDVAWHFLGRWWADNSNPRDRARVGEYNRLRTLYGAYEDDRVWEASMAHSLKAYDPTGKPITTVVDDPDGVQSGAGQTPMGREMSLEAQVEVMKQQMAQMMAQLEDKQRREATDVAPDVPPMAPPMPSPYNPAGPVPPAPTVAGTAVPVAPAPMGIPAAGNAAHDPEAQDLGVIGGQIPVKAQVAYDPNEAEAPEDNPQVVKTSPQGGRVG